MSPPILPEWRPRKTLIDLYNEKDGTAWYYRLGATVSALMLAIGFLIFSSNIAQNCHPTATTLTPSLVGALVLLILAYAICGITFVYSKSWIFQFDILCIPHLSSSLFGLICILYAVSIHDGALSAASLSARFGIFALVVSLISIIVYLILSIIVFRKMYIVRARDALFHLAPQSKETGPLREDEEQRQQLSRLLHQQNEKMTNNPDSATQTTFKIDWPGHNKIQSRRSSLLSTVQETSAARMSRYPSQRSQFGRNDHITGSIDRLPSIRVESHSRFSSWFNSAHQASTNTPPTSHFSVGIPQHPQPVSQDSSTPSSESTTSLPPPLQPLAYIPPSQHNRYFTFDTSPAASQPGTPQSALPSYSAHAHPSMEISTRPLVGAGDFPVEKEEVVEVLPARGQRSLGREGMYWMADEG